MITTANEREREREREREKEREGDRERERERERERVRPSPEAPWRHHPFIGDSNFRFLGAPITIHHFTADQRGVLLTKLEDMLKKVDETLLTRQQKLHLQP